VAYSILVTEEIPGATSTEHLACLYRSWRRDSHGCDAVTVDPCSIFRRDFFLQIVSQTRFFFFLLMSRNSWTRWVRLIAKFWVEMTDHTRALINSYFFSHFMSSQFLSLRTSHAQLLRLHDYNCCQQMSVPFWNGLSFAYADAVCVSWSLSFGSSHRICTDVLSCTVGHCHIYWQTLCAYHEWLKREMSDRYVGTCRTEHLKAVSVFLSDLL